MKSLAKSLWSSRGKILVVLMFTLMAGMQVFGLSISSGTTEGDFKDIIKFIARWTTYLGAAIAFFGAVQLAFGFRSDDAEGKNKGMRSMIAGFIVIAIALAADAFMSMAG